MLMVLSDWQDNGEGYYEFIHVVDNAAGPCSDDTFKRHLLLEFLDYLKVIEYTRGYDGRYYDIRVKIRD